MKSDENFNPVEAAAALKKIFQPGDVFEIRALDATTATYTRPHTVSGYFDFEHIDAAAALIEKTIRSARGIYYTPNPVNPALLARAANRFRDMGKSDPSTADKDIPRRRWLLIDCDAIRPTGISSSEAEHQAAADKAAEIKTGFASMGFPDPVEIDSGNGAQLMYRIDLPGNDNTICKGILHQLQAVNTDAVDIDETVYNAARIWRLPGSMNCKGDQIPDRPHRRARIIRFPEKPQLVPIELLKKAAGIQDEKPFDPADYPQPENAAHAQLSGINFSEIKTQPEKENFKIENWIKKYCPDAEGPEPWQNGRKWIFPVCPFNPEHRNRSAVITEQASGEIGFTCHHNSCKGNDWPALRKLLDPDFSNRQQAAPQKKEPQHDPPPAPEIENEEPQPEPEPAPWRDVTTDDIRAVIDGTFLGEMAKLYSCVTDPELPLEAALLKAIVTAGCALSGPGTPDAAKQGLLPPIGIQRARLMINTAGGQVCNVYALLAANSASGKDIGNLLDQITTARGWNLGTSGSAEGIAEALKEFPNGLISISEFMNWLDERHWQHKATSFLTEAFSKGHFKHNFSSRSGKNGISSCDYCYPNIIANIQPEVFENVVRTQDIASGFLGRFIYAKMPEFFGDPAIFDRTKILQRFNDILLQFEKKHGVVDVPAGYGKVLSDMFKKYSPPMLHPVWRRLTNEYMPRFAVMLSINHQARSQGDAVLLEQKHWTAAAKMVLWFFKQAEELLINIDDMPPEAKRKEKIYKRIIEIIKKNDKGNGVLRSVISQYVKQGTNEKERREFLSELIDRGWIEIILKGQTVYDKGARFKIKSGAQLPPGF